MRLEDISLYTKDGLKLHGKLSKTKNAKALLCIVHGFSEHIGRYEEFFSYFHSKNIACVGTDLRGHGLSDGLKGHAPSLSLLMSDIEELMKAGRSEYTDLPMFLFGHSLGGGLVLRYVVNENINELAGFISSSPWIELAFDPPRWKTTAGAIASSILPRLRLSSNLKPEHLSRDPEVVKQYKNDPLIHLKISARLFDIMKKNGSKLISHSENLKKPGLIYHGDADHVTSAGASKTFFANHKKNTEYHLIEGVFHEPHQDFGKEKIFEKIYNWIEKQVK